MIKKYCIDIDNTICFTKNGEYKDSKPILHRIEVINNLKKQGHHIIFFTARGSTTGLDWKDLTERQLEEWGIKYDELVLGKPEADIFIDDKSFGDYKLDEFHNFDNLSQNVRDHIDGIKSLLKPEAKYIYQSLLRICSSAINSKNKIIFCGNGGSATDSAHMAAELVCRLKKEGKSIPSIALGTNYAINSAWANDYEYESAIKRELQASGKEGDVLICLSTSGKSINIKQAVEESKLMKISTVLISGSNPNIECDLNFKIDSSTTERIQEIYMVLLHTLCQDLELNYR